MANDGKVVIGTEIDDTGAKIGMQKLGATVGKLGINIAKGLAVGIGVATTAIGGLVIAATKAYASYEQLVGGVDTLFKDSSQKVQEYANNAYKTAGMSANAYMETVTSFSASLLQSLAGDTEKSAEVADMAIIDMSDNANKMGTSMEMIQNAYQGFAKQNYTMLDNLKLGYGGTKEEMQRLLTDAEKLSGQEYNISNLNDVYQAIHVIQTEIGITGTTALEASTTIEGSVKSMKSSFENLIAGLGNDDADIGTLINNVVDSTTTALTNILPRVEQILNGIGEMITTLLPVILDRVPNIIQNVIPEILTNVLLMIQTILDGLQQALPTLLKGALDILFNIVESIVSMLPQIVQILITLIVTIANRLAAELPTLIQTIINALFDAIMTLLDNAPVIIDAVITLFESLADAVMIAVPLLLDLIPQILEKLAIAFGENYPLLLESVIYVLMELLVAIVELLPDLIEAIFEIAMAVITLCITEIDTVLKRYFGTSITSIVDFFSEIIDNIIEFFANIFAKVFDAIPKIIDFVINYVKELPEKIGEVLATVILKIIEWRDLLISKAIQIATDFITEYIERLKEMPEKVKNILLTVLQKVIDFKQSMIDAGVNLVKGLWQGISNMKDWIMDKIKSFCDGIVGGIKELFGIHSPSKVMQDEVGKFLAQGIEVGFVKENPMHQIGKSLTSGIDNLQMNLLSNIAGANRSNYNQTVNFNQSMQSPDEIARALRMQNTYGLAGAY